MAFICKSCAGRLNNPKYLNRRGLTTAASTPISTTYLPLDKPAPQRPPSQSSAALIPQPQPQPLIKRERDIISPDTLTYYWDTQPPTPAQLTFASRFFTIHPPSLLYTSVQFRTIPTTSAPEVAFLGRSNVGKSSFLNALLGKKIAYTSTKPGKTKVMNAFGVNGASVGAGKFGGLIVLDTPGYGHAGRKEWGTEMLKYLKGRKQLRRVFVLVDAVHNVKRTDEMLLYILRQNAIPHQVILSKVDRILLSSNNKIPGAHKRSRRIAALRKVLEDLKPIIQPGSKEGPGALGEILSCSAEKSVESGKKLGIDAVRWAVLSATGLENLSSTRPRKTPVSGSRQQEMDDEYPESY